MKRILAFTYGTLCYGVFFGTFLYAIGFLGNFGVPKSIDSGPDGSAGRGARDRRRAARPVRPAAQHHGATVVQALAGRALCRSRSSAAPTCCFRSLALLLLFWQWRPIGGVIWDCDGARRRCSVRGVRGWAGCIVLLSTFLINHFDLFGLRQVWLYLDRTAVLRTFVPDAVLLPLSCAIRCMWAGCSTFWATPHDDRGHLFFAAITTAYILVAIQFGGARPDRAARRRLSRLPARGADDRAVAAGKPTRRNRNHIQGGARTSPERRR